MVSGNKMIKIFFNFFVCIGNAIFSIDVHPDGSRFATGGQGSD